MAKRRPSAAQRMAEEDAAEPRESSPTDLAKVTQAADAMVKLDAEIEKWEALIKGATKRRRVLAQETLPALMDDVDVTSFQLKSGGAVAIKPFIRLSIPSKSAIEQQKDPIEKAALIERQKKAFAFLRASKSGDLIKSTLVVEAGRGTTDKIKAVLAVVRQQKLSHRRDRAVPPPSLKKWAKERLEAGKKVDAVAFALFHGREAQITKPKKASSK